MKIYQNIINNLNDIDKSKCPFNFEDLDDHIYQSINKTNIFHDDFIIPIKYISRYIKGNQFGIQLYKLKI